MFAEQRQSFRILAAPGHEQAMLRVGWRQIKVRLLDESLGGYAISSRKSIKTKIGEHLTLRTATGSYFVEVVRLERLSDGTILGLRRLAELNEKPEETLGAGWLTLAAATGMLLVIALRPYLTSEPIRWRLPAWTASLNRSVERASVLFDQERAPQGGAATAENHR
jgi:hypothetical protein